MVLRALIPALLAALSGRCVTSNATPNARDAATVEARYLSLGDSFTIGTGIAAAQAFPSRLAARWSTPRCRVALRNPAVNGYTTQDLIDRELPELSRFSPTWVTLAVGANDLVRGSDTARYRAQLARIFDAIAAAGVAASRVVTIPQPDWARTPAGRSFGEPEATHARVVAFNAVLREVSVERGARYVDLFEVMVAQGRDEWIAPDGLHPDARAHDAWADALAREIPSPCQ